MKHTIEFPDLEEFTSETQLAGAFGQGENKKLLLSTKILNGKAYTTFVVKRNNQVVKELDDLVMAIIEYNKI